MPGKCLEIVEIAEFCRSCVAAALVWLLPPAMLLLGLLVLLHWRHRSEARAHELLRTRLFERDRQTRQLHDRLLQGMHGLILRFQAMSERLPVQDATRSGFDAALSRADQVLNDSRDAVAMLQQRDPTGDDLARALDDTGRRFAHDGGHRFMVQVGGVPRELRAEVQHELQQILSEALSNAFRHARAGRIEVTLHYGSWHFSAKVLDDGIGMTRELVRRGWPGRFGMAGMRERAECIAARLSWRSRPGAGTTVELKLPAHRAYLSS